MSYLLVYLFVTAITLLAFNRRASLILSGIFIFFAITVTSWLAIEVLVSGVMPDIGLQGAITCDRLSAVFILIINFTAATGFIYSTGYLKPYVQSKPAAWLRLHYVALAWLQISMVAVVLFRDGFSFLIAWELMTLSSFVLVIFDYDIKGTMAAGINYLVQMHIGMLFILVALIISSKVSGSVSFDSLTAYFRVFPNWPVFLLFFIGFGLKAGFILLHTWLPEAHPAAPSHVSGIMSGVMIKLGIYGILRVSMYLQSDMYYIGIALIMYSAGTGLFGVMMAIFQHDIKKLLAYHSIENIGIIGIGIGLGIFGNATGNNLIAVAGYTGAILHTLNHSLFKSLLFYSAGSVIQQLHTRNIEKMGGVMKFMPYTALSFLIGSIAISGLPPFNGFVSEYLVYFSLFTGIGSLEFYPLLIFTVAMVSLVLIGGLAIFCFTKVFSIMFLGQPRTKLPEHTSESSGVMLSAKILPVILIVFIGVVPALTVGPLTGIASDLFVRQGLFDPEPIMTPVKYLSLTAAIMVAAGLTFWLIRKLFEIRRKPVPGPTWGCGYTAVNPRQQYTATSFIQEYAGLIRPLIKNGASNITYKQEEIFPEERDFHSSSSDFFRSKIILRPANYIVNLLRRAAVMQTGNLQHYVLYALVFMVLIFLLTVLNII